MTRRYRVRVQGLRNIPERGGVLLLGNHISWIDWAMLQIACPRPVRFVMLKSIYERWYSTWFFKLFGVVPINQGAGAQGSLRQIATAARSRRGDLPVPGGDHQSRTGHLG